MQVEGETITITRQDGSLVEATVTGEAAQHEIVEVFRKNNVPVEFRPLQPGLWVSILNWLIPILTLGLIGLVGWRVYASMSGHGTFEVSDQSGSQTVSFDQVAGVDEARAELTETIEFLKEPQRFGRLGGRVPAVFCCTGHQEQAKHFLRELLRRRPECRFSQLRVQVFRRNLLV